MTLTVNNDITPLNDNVLTENLFVWWQPQLITLIYVTLLLTILSLIVFYKVKKVKPNESPKGIVFLAEQYVGFFNTEFNGISEGRIDRVGPYLFTLMTFLIVGNTAGLIGLEPIVTSYSVPLTLGLITWIGIYVLGIIHQRFRYFKQFLNPINIVGSVSPLISISFRIFGNVLGGSILMFVIYYSAGALWGYIPVIGDVNLLGMLIAPWFHMYFDIFGALVQSFVFMLLTGIYWSNEVQAGNEIKEEKKQKDKEKQLQN